MTSLRYFRSSAVAGGSARPTRPGCEDRASGLGSLVPILSGGDLRNRDAIRAERPTPIRSLRAGTGCGGCVQFRGEPTRWKIDSESRRARDQAVTRGVHRYATCSPARADPPSDGVEESQIALPAGVSFERTGVGRPVLTAGLRPGLSYGPRARRAARSCRIGWNARSPAEAVVRRGDAVSRPPARSKERDSEARCQRETATSIEHPRGAPLPADFLHDAVDEDLGGAFVRLGLCGRLGDRFSIDRSDSALLLQLAHSRCALDLGS